MKNYQSSKKIFHNKLIDTINRIDRKVKIDDNDSEFIPIVIEKCFKCNKNESKYTCPKCKIKYCSVDCYKSHNISCSEEFYKNQIIEELKSDKVSTEESKKFRHTLKDYYDKISENENQNYLLSEDRIKHLEMIYDKIENNELDLLNDITPQDWSEFNHYLSTGKIYQEIMLWKPFWESLIENEFEISCIYDSSLLNRYDEKSLEILKNYEVNQYIEFYSNNDVLNMEMIKLNNELIPISREIIYHSLILKYEQINDLDKITKIEPNPCIKYTLINIICTMVYVFKLFNGDINMNINEVTAIILEFSKVLFKNEIIFLTTSNAIDEFFNSLSQREVKNIIRTKKMIISDIIKIFNNKFLIFETFIRLYEVLNKSKKKVISKAKNKVIYLLSYIKSQRGLDEIISELNNYFILTEKL